MYEVQPKQDYLNFELKNEGIYFVAITSNGKTVTEKVIITR